MHQSNEDLDHVVSNIHCGFNNLISWTTWPENIHLKKDVKMFVSVPKLEKVNSYDKSNLFKPYCLWEQEFVFIEIKDPYWKVGEFGENLTHDITDWWQ